MYKDKSEVIYISYAQKTAKNFFFLRLYWNFKKGCIIYFFLPLKNTHSPQDLSWDL